MINHETRNMKHETSRTMLMVLAELFHVSCFMFCGHKWNLKK